MPDTAHSAVISAPAAALAPAGLIRRHMPELDSLRGIAVLMVVLYHALYFSLGPGHPGWAGVLIAATQPGWLGVNLFFVLSGFLITGVLLDSKPRPHYYRTFYSRRALRILPAYYGLLFLMLAAGAISSAYFALSFVYLSNLSLLFGVPAQYGVLWSLAVEEHFYLVWPTVVRRSSPRLLLLVAAALVAATPVIRYAGFLLGSVDSLYYYTWFVMDGLAAGACVAVLARAYPDARRAWRRGSTALIGAGALLLLLGAPFGIMHRTRALGAALQETPWNLIFAGVLIAALLLGSGGRLARQGPAVLRFFGKISYGLYLIHLWVFHGYDVLVQHWLPRLGVDGGLGPALIRLGLAGSAAVGLAYLSRRFFEEPFLRLKPRVSPAPSPTRTPTW